MHAKGTVRLTGSGTASASRSDDPACEGNITGPDCFGTKLIADSALTVEGTLQFKPLELENRGRLLVDRAADEMVFGLPALDPRLAKLSGGGRWRVEAAGRLSFRTVRFLNTLSGEFEISSGGKMHLAAYGGDFTPGSPRVVITGGTPDIDRHFVAGRGLSLAKGPDPAALPGRPGAVADSPSVIQNAPTPSAISRPTASWWMVSVPS